MTVVVYSTKRCPHCKALKDALNFVGVEFSERDLGDADVIAELYTKDVFVRSSPVLQVDETYYMTDEIFDERGVPKPAFILTLTK